MIGIVMAGGLSSRLGRDKARLSLYDQKGPALLERTATLLQACTDAVFVSCRAAQDVSPYPAIHDETEGQGPAGGLLSVLRTVKEPVLILSCDLPFMEEAPLRRLLDARNLRRPESVMTAFHHTGNGRVEPLVAVYDQEARMWFENAATEGNRRLGLIIPAERRTLVPVLPEETPAFFNLNTPQDLEAARLLAHARFPCGSSRRS